MRELKFRVWDKVSKKMCSWETIWGWEMQNIEDEDFVFMQYTGLKDKNGVEIYEGDIIEDERDLEASFGIVEWIECRFALCYNNDMAIDFFYINNYETNKNMRVVGNIYENMEKIKNYSKNGAIC